jgi:hypothetical protein
VSCSVRLSPLQAEAHNERLISLIEAPASRLLQQTTGESVELRGRIAELEQKHTALLESSQASLDRAHERQLREQEEQARLAMKFEAFATLKQLAPILIGRVMGHHGDANGAAQVLRQGFLSSLTQEQVLKLFESGILSDAQGAMLANIVKDLTSDESRDCPADTKSEEPTDRQSGDNTSGEGDES